MDNEMAYLLGMITGNGEIQRGKIDTTVSIEIPHKKLETEFQNDVSIYVKASIADIREALEPLSGVAFKFTQNKNVSMLSFTKNNEDYLMREILRYLDGATSSENVRISPEVFAFSVDQRKQFIKGFADVTGYIRRSNYAYGVKSDHRVYFEIPHNWWLVIDFCNLLKSIDIPVQNIDWAHPNMRDPNLVFYNKGKINYWKKEHQVKVWALEYQTVGFMILHKQEALNYFADEQRDYYIKHNKNTAERLHKYYWETRHRIKNNPIHPGENDDVIPIEIRGKHYRNWTDIAKDLGYGEDE